MLYRRLLGPALLGALCTGGYYALNVSGLNLGLVAVDPFYGEQFFAVLSTLYAITTAMVMIKGLETVNSLSASILREATKIRSVGSLSAAFEGEDARAAMRRLRGELMIYVDNVREQKGADRSRKNDGVIDGCRRIVASIGAQTHVDVLLKIELLREIEALRLLRAERAAIAETRLPGYLVWMLAVMTAAIIAPFFLEHTAAINFNYYAIFLLSGFGSFIFFMILDINQPYDGLWQVNFAPLDEASADLETSLETR